MTRLLLVLALCATAVGGQICIPLGDVDNSGSISMSDAVYLINYIFAGGPAPDTICVDPDTSSMELWWTMPGLASATTYAEAIYVLERSPWDSSIISAWHITPDSTIQGGDTMRLTVPVRNDGSTQRFDVWWSVGESWDGATLLQVTSYGIERRRVTVVEKK